jgi:hypothetical protein
MNKYHRITFPNVNVMNTVAIDENAFEFRFCTGIALPFGSVAVIA